jgi:two-component system OmpR family sensor kinase
VKIFSSIRTRLIVGSVVLTGVAGIAIGATSVLGARTFLLGQLDEEVIQTANLITTLNPVELEQRIHGPGLPVGTIIAVKQSDKTAGVYLDSHADAELLTADQLKYISFENWGAQPQAVSVPGVGNYRMAEAVQPADADADTEAIVLVGLPTDSIDRSIGRIALLAATLIAVILTAVGILTRTVIDLAIGPLQRMRETSQRIANMKLESGEADINERVELDGAPTEIVELGDSFNKMLDNVDQALNARRQSENRMRQFVADASHELRTPLTAIRGYSELTRRQKMVVNDDLRHALDRIESESLRMTTLVEDLLLLARLDEGRELELKPVDVSKVAREAVADAKVAGKDHNWTVRTAKDAFILADAGQIHQVLANLLANARTHTPAGTKVATTVEVEENHVKIVVSDTGPGIPEEIRESLFERFARADTSRARATGSTGLGLAIVEGLVRAHHGNITVESKSGKTSFIVKIPRYTK